MQPCWGVLAAFERRIDVEWDGAFVLNFPMAWVARNSSKPGRASSPDCWVFYATPDWSAARLNVTRDQLMTTLLGEFTRITSAPPPPTINLDAHRWL
jgi:predicted NAD/FAD-dependent oxidoreductase